MGTAISPLARRVRQYFDDNDIHYFFDGKSRFRVMLPVECRMHHIDLSINTCEEIFLLLAHPSIKPDRTDEATIRKLVMMLTRANYKLRMGNFDIDPDDGDTFFRICVPYGDGDLPSERMLDALIATACSTWTDYGDDYLRLVLADFIDGDEDGATDDEDDPDEDDGENTDDVDTESSSEPAD
ncbi:YbjN domain-containing protein [Bifidobacterium sp. MA2]|uniref:YbjN domain-containing protein n=1 Tax=Bifidobacterium santillanense TaxID=2809028 RepID=A0ABS5USD4_9BIFI|nr:YbjN domain-containing protein [Bifidobacterium santillanense]MBT1173807.1 YbjN domain-containing protein [Bifidobacterium santillanense]